MALFERAPVGIRGASHAHGLATAMLRDFAAAGVDEDLEILRSQWSRPRHSSYDDDDEGAMDSGRVRSGALDYRSGSRLGTLAAQPIGQRLPMQGAARPAPKCEN